MSEPLAHRFTPGDHGQPEVNYVVDLRCVCRSCGHPQDERLHPSVPFHSLTLTSLQSLAAEAHLHVAHACAECGDKAIPEGVSRAVTTYAFPDDAGTIRIFVEEPEDGAAMQFELDEHRRFDPDQPQIWQPDSERGEVLDRVDEMDVEDIFERVFSPKLLWSEMFTDWLEDPVGGAFSRISQTYWLVIDESEQMAGELVEEIEDVEFDAEFVDGQLVVVPLLESTPDGLVTQEHPEHLPGRWRTWLPEAAERALDAGDVWAEAYVVARRVSEKLAETLQEADLAFRVEQTAADTYFFEMSTPSDVVYGRGVSVSSVIRRAVFTGMTPEEAARLTGEEIAGMLLGSWEESEH